MLKKNTLILLFIFPVIVFGQKILHNSSQNNALISKFMSLSQQQLYDTATYYHHKNCLDTALFCYGLIINAPSSNDPEQLLRVLGSLNATGVIYCNLYDLKRAHKYFIDALLLYEKYPFPDKEYSIYNNLGLIYGYFNQHDIAKQYFIKSASVCVNSKYLDLMYNNIGHIEMMSGNIDSACYWLQKGLQLGKQFGSKNLCLTLLTFAQTYSKIKQYDSALYYYQSAIYEARNNDNIKAVCETLSQLGNLFFEINKFDSALYYINLSNQIAAENHFLGTTSENYLILSKIEESKGNIIKAFQHYKTYVNIKDSVFNTNIFNDVNQYQRLYEVSKTNQQIEQLMIEQQIKERTIHYQKIIWWITLSVLLLVSAGLMIFYLQNKKLNRAYKVLFEKNIEIIELSESSEQSPEKHRNSVLTEVQKNELLDKILIIMEDTATVCDIEFSLDKLAELAGTNHAYISHTINASLKKNFCSFLNEYRIKEAQRLFSLPEITKYTIESIALKVGFKSANSFRSAFTKITGVTPNFYLKSIQEQGKF